VEAVHGPVAPIRSEADAAAWLESLINVERRPDWPYRRFDLTPVRRLLARAGDPQRGLRAIHVAGSKGKGSTVLLAESVLRAAGRRVGTFTSPHLERWTERFRLDGRDVDGARLAAAVERLRLHVEWLRRDDAECAPTFFDVTTAAALLLFQEARVDVALLEVGLGGRLDSTNVIEPAVTCITSIELEHTDRLGHSHGEIAREKAGILKPGVPAVAGALSAEARDVVQARADALGAPVTWLGGELRAEVRSQGPEGLELYLQDCGFAVDATLGVLGAHQADNAALALACVRRCGAIPEADLAEAARRGLAAARLPARGELLRSRPGILVDAAHTPASARALARMLAALPRQRTHLVLSISSGKDVVSILEILLPAADRVTVTRAEPSRSLAPDLVADAVRRAAPGLELRVVPNPHLALRAAAEALAPDDLLCATGSVYLAGIARRVLRGPDPAARVAVTRRSGRGPVAGR
jgi:dihydrofolate synthase/folylpolyglutamate synthase